MKSLTLVLVVAFTLSALAAGPKMTIKKKYVPKPKDVVETKLDVCDCHETGNCLCNASECKCKDCEKHSTVITQEAVPPEPEDVKSPQKKSFTATIPNELREGLEPTGRTKWPDGSSPINEQGCLWIQEHNPNAGNSEADWFWVEYKNKSVAVEKPLAKRIQNEIPTDNFQVPILPFALLSNTEWDDSALEGVRKNTFVVQSLGDFKTADVYVPEWCGGDGCKLIKKMLADINDPDFKIVWHPEKEGVNGAKEYPCIWNRSAKKFYYLEDFDSVVSLKKLYGINDPIVGGFVAGKVKRSKIAPFLAILGDSGDITLSNPEQDIDLHGVTVKLPAKLRISWRTDNGVMKFDFPAGKPMVSWGWLQKRIDGMLFNGSQIEFDLPNIVNPIVVVEDDMPQGTPQPFLLKNSQPKLTKAVRHETSSQLATNEAAPTPIPEVVRVLNLLPKPQIAFVDFGCGYDARWCLAATELWGCRAIGVENNHERAMEARERVHNLGLGHLITIIEGDAETTDVKGDVAVAYLYPDLLARLKPRLEKFNAVASYMHAVPGLPMQQSGDSWIYRRQSVMASPLQQNNNPSAVWGGMAYSGPVCNSRNCQMCNSIRQQMSR